MSPPGLQTGCNLSEVREPEKVWSGGEGGVYGWQEHWTAEWGREVATELTVLKIAKSKIPGVLVGVGCGSGEDGRIRENMKYKVPRWGAGDRNRTGKSEISFQLV